MPRFEVTSPDGRTFEVNGPPGSTQEQAIEYIRSQQERQGAEPSAPRNNLAETLAQIDTMQPAGAPAGKYNPEGSTTAYLAEQLRKGVALGAGFPVDTAANIANLGIAGYGVAKNLLTGSSDLPELIRDPFGGSGTFEKLFAANRNIAPTSRTAEVAGRFARDLGAVSLPAAGIASRTAAPLQSLGLQGILSTAASAGGETARALAPEPYKDAADLTGVLAGGVVAPGVLANRIDGILALRNATTPNKVNAMADQYVGRQIEGNVRAYPGAAQNLDEALRVGESIPGFNPRIGQASGVPSLLNMEKRVATAGPEEFNRRVLQDQQQQAAIRTQAEQRLPLLAGTDDVAAQLAATQARRRGLAEALPETDPGDTGRLLRDTRSSMKGRYDQIAAEKFEAPVAEAEKLNVKIDPSGLIAKATELHQNPILQFDATNSPTVLRRIFDASTKTTQEAKGPVLLDSRGQPYVTSKEHGVPLTFKELKAMREAVNQDIAREATSSNPNARQRLRALVEIRQEIDSTARQAPESVRKLYNEAVTWYRDVYAPKFLRGVNLKQTMKDITGELRTPDEKLAAQYFKPLATTQMKRFIDLYGENGQAMRAMESHVLDTYRKAVVRDGVIDPAKHETFLRNYGAPLRMLPGTEGNFRSLSSASAILAEREAQLASAQKVLSQGQLDALKYDSLPDAGLDPRRINSFLQRNSDSFQESISEIYGKKVAEDHLKNLREIAKAAEIADRGRLPDAAAPAQGISPISMQGALGFSGRTVFSMLRAITTGRTSPHDMAYTLGAQSATHRIGRALIAAEERAISDPETAKLIAQAIKQPATPNGMLTLKSIINKGGEYLVGGNKFAEFGKYRAAPMAIQATQDGMQEDTYP